MAIHRKYCNITTVNADGLLLTFNLLVELGLWAFYGVVHGLESFTSGIIGYDGKDIPVIMYKAGI